MKRFSFSSLMLVLGLLFIYLPMLILVIYSFNASKLVTVSYTHLTLPTILLV